MIPSSSAQASLLRGAALLLAITASTTARAENIVYPADSGVINVKNAPYNAKGDGVTDDTAAIQQAISANLNGSKIIYLPNGTYLVSDRLQWRNVTTGFSAGWGAYLSMQGQSQAGTIIKLKNGATGYNSASSPKAVIYTASRDDQNVYDDATGPGNQAFQNSVKNLTVDIGSGNLGAIGIDYQVSNWGSLRNVTVRTSDPAQAGYAGVSMTRRDNGPGLVKNLQVTGFQHGVLIGDFSYGMVLDTISLSNQTTDGISITDEPTSIENFTSANTVPALVINGNTVVNLINANLTGGAATNVAIDNQGGNSHLYARNITTSGYANAIRNRGVAVAGVATPEYVSDAIKSLNTSPQRSLGLAFPETPTYFDSNLADWKSAGPASGGDDTAHIQSILSSGGSVVYFPNGNYHVSTTLHVPATVKHLVGLESHILAASTTSFSATPVFSFEGAGSDAVLMEGFHVEVNANCIGVQQSTTRTVVLQDGEVGGQTISYQNTAGCGPLYLEDVIASVHLPNSQLVYARQLDLEQGDSSVINSGATMVILGAKSERTDTIFQNLSGGKLEILGGSFDTFGSAPAGHPIFVNNASSLTASFCGTAYNSGFFFTNLVTETRSGTTTNFAASSAYWRGLGTSMPLYVGYQTGAVPISFETETLTVPAKSAATHRIIADPAFSNGQGTILDATTTGDYVTYLVPNISAGAYDVRVGVKCLNTRGRIQLTVGRADNFAGTSAPVGAVQDEYNANQVFTEFDLGAWMPGTTSDKWFQFMVTGKNSASAGYTECLDYIKLIPQ